MRASNSSTCKNDPHTDILACRLGQLSWLQTRAQNRESDRGHHLPFLLSAFKSPELNQTLCTIGTIAYLQVYVHSIGVVDV